jgi:hypothetical protein
MQWGSVYSVQEYSVKAKASEDLRIKYTILSLLRIHLRLLNTAFAFRYEVRIVAHVPVDRHWWRSIIEPGASGYQ